jgi:hypothetical protein
MSDSKDKPDEQIPYSPKSIEETIKLRRLQQDYQGKAHRDVITAGLARTLIIIMGVSLCVHYLAVAFFVTRGNTEAVEAFRGVFNAWLPVISGLVGAAVAYYFANSK